MKIKDYQDALDALHGDKKYRVRKSVGPNTYLEVQTEGGGVWDTKAHGPPEFSRGIGLTFYGHTIVRWLFKDSIVRFPSNSTTRTVFRRINDFTNFQVWSKGGNSFIQLRGTEHVYPYPYMDELDALTGRPPEHHSDAWLCNYNASELHDSTPSVANSHARALLTGKLTFGWNKSLQESWGEEYGLLASPDLLHLMTAFQETGIHDMRIVLGAISMNNDPRYFESLFKSCHPANYRAYWKPRTEKERLKQTSMRLTGTLAKVPNLILNGGPRSLPVERAWDMCALVKASIAEGLCSAARLRYV
jgi:hypothetical protein